MGEFIRSRTTKNQVRNNDLYYYIIYKPYGMMSQFSKESEKPTLADLPFKFPKDVYPVGRLDHDSEGLLLLTNDKRLNSQLLNPKNHYKKTYWVQVDREITSEAIVKLSTGVIIKIDKPYQTKPAIVHKIDEPNIPERIPPIRFRLNVPTSWIEITLTEGKNRQIRKMTAAVGFPTLRLIRSGIGSISIANMQPNDVIKLSINDVSKLYKL